MVTTITLCLATILEKSYKSFKPEVFPPPCIQNITGNSLSELLAGALISKYRQSSDPEKNPSPSEPPIPEGLCTQKLFSLEVKTREGLSIFLGAFQRRLPIGGLA